jgi:hypothetical protein
MHRKYRPLIIGKEVVLFKKSEERRDPLKTTRLVRYTEDVVVWKKRRISI